jgi:hypothetical protein
VGTWGEFAAAESELAAFGAERLLIPPAYLATVRRSGAPRVHPVTPILTADGLFTFMEPTSPKGHDLRERGGFALHNGVPDDEGTGGEFFCSGRAFSVEDPSVRASSRTRRGTSPSRGTCCSSFSPPRPDATATAT